MTLFLLTASGAELFDVKHSVSDVNGMVGVSRT